MERAMFALLVMLSVFIIFIFLGVAMTVRALRDRSPLPQVSQHRCELAPWGKACGKYLATKEGLLK